MVLLSMLETSSHGQFIKLPPPLFFRILYISYIIILNKYIHGGACGVMVTVVGNGHDNLNSNPGLGCLHFTYLGKCIDLTILLTAMGK